MTTETTTEPKLAKTATITLHAADGSTMQIIAERKGNAARTYIITTDTAKKSARGMTQDHDSFEVAVAASQKALDAAKKLDPSHGWQAFQPKPDAFSSIPPRRRGRSNG